MKKYIEIVKYAFWGGISTIINLAILFFLLSCTSIHYIVSNTIAYVIAVLINFVFNKKFVFNSKKNAKRELLLFIIIRLISLLVDNCCYYIAVDVLNYNLYISRLFLSCLIIIITYFANKVLVFNAKK